MEQTYKVGDQVRLTVLYLLDINKGLKVGDLFTINRIDSDGGLRVTVADNDRYPMSPKQVEPGGPKKLGRPCGPKAPRYLVIWMEDRDPVKEFHTKLEAEAFIKELGQKSEVRKESVKLVTVERWEEVTFSSNFSLKKLQFKRV